MRMTRFLARLGCLTVLGLCCIFLTATGARGADLPGADSLRAAVEDLTATFGPQYPEAKQYLGRLDALVRRAESATGPQGEAIRQEFEELRREALVANPLVSGQPILYAMRKQYRGDHHNTATMFQTGEINTGSFTGGAAIKTVDVVTGEVTTLLETPEGVARDLDLGFDGRKVLFSLRHRKDDDYHLYEIDADGENLRQLTFGPGLSDIDPIYLPDGQIMFTSTREPKFCMCNRHIMGNLFTMEADGANIQQIGHSTLHEGHASVLEDGRVIYDRWEYVDRNFGDAQGVWVVNPDGTNHAVFWGNNTNSPGAVLDNRGIPGTELFIGTFSSCHDRPWGALAIVDRRKGIDGREPVVRTWPASAIDLVGKGNYDTYKKVNPKYEDPYPLSDKYFLCSRMIGKGEEVGIYLLDLFGNEILLHADAPGCYDPMPLAARPKPPGIPSRIDLTKNEGYFTSPTSTRGPAWSGSSGVRSSICAWSSRRRSGSGPNRRGTAAARKPPAWPGTTLITNGSWGPFRWNPTAAFISPCRPIRSSISNFSTSGG